MKILSNLAAEAADGTWPAAGTMIAVMDESKIDGKRSGVFRQVELGPKGLVIHRGGDGVAIPLAELLKLAEVHEPALKPS
jgi:hypothetical protein